MTGTLALAGPRGLSLDRPWSAAVPAGLKAFETRGWQTRYRGPLAIHATVKTVARIIEEQGLEDDWLLAAADALRVDSLTQLPAGAVVAIADLACCIPTDDFRPGQPEKWWGNYAPRRYAWGLVTIRPLAVPFPLKGHQGLWSIDTETWAQLEERALDPLPPGLLELAAQSVADHFLHGTNKPGDPAPRGILNATKIDTVVGWNIYQRPAEASPTA